MCQLELIDNSALKLYLKNKTADIILARIERSELINRDKEVSQILIHWGVDEVTDLNELIRLKKSAPSPIVRDYEWCGLYNPFEHQRITSEFLSINKKAFCFNEAGTGKTSSVLWSADYLMNESIIKKVLIICPLSIMYSAWQGDVFNTCMHRTSAVCHGTANKRKKIIEGCPERVPKFTNAWRDKVMYQISRFKWIPRPNSKKEVFRVLQPAIRFAKNECLDLPDVMYQTRDIPLTKQAEKYYKELKNQMLIEMSGESITAVNAAAGLNKLLQISGGAVYTDDKKVIEFDITPRLKALQEAIDETDHKVIIFVPYRHTIEVVSKYLTANKISNEVINGSVSATKRADIISRFQISDEPRVLVIQPQSASHGVTLTRANVVLFWSPVMSVEVYLQCIARMDRVGQKNKMTVVHLQGSDVEKRMYAMLRGKVDQHTALVDLYREEIGA